MAFQSDVWPYVGKHSYTIRARHPYLLMFVGVCLLLESLATRLTALLRIFPSAHKKALRIYKAIPYVATRCAIRKQTWYLFLNCNVFVSNHAVFVSHSLGIVPYSYHIRAALASLDL